MAHISTTLLRRGLRPAAAALHTSAPAAGGGGNPLVIQRHGTREVVGYGYNGGSNYQDRIDYPYPAIRFKETTPEIQLLRDKETGDWKKLTVEEKKALYRASFCRTFAEMQAPTGDWKRILGIGFALMSGAIWGYLGLKMFVYEPMPTTITDPAKMEAQVQRMIDLRVNPIEGLGSKWDYEKGQWK